MAFYFFQILVIVYMVFFLYTIFSRRGRATEYEGELRALPSAVHAFLSMFLFAGVISNVIILLIGIFRLFQGWSITGVIILLLRVIGYSAISFFYVRWRIKKLETIVSYQSGIRTFGAQILLGLGTINYTGLCVVLFFLMFFGVSLFDYDFD